MCRLAIAWAPSSATLLAAENTSMLRRCVASRASMSMPGILKASMFRILKSAIILEKSMSNMEGGLLAIMRSCGPGAGAGRTGRCWGTAQVRSR